MLEKLFPELFLKNRNWEYLWIQVEDCQNMLKLSCRPLAFISYKAFLKNKKRPGTSLLVLFSWWFLKKNISCLTFYYLTRFNWLVAFTSWDFVQYVYCNCLLSRSWCHKFWNLIFQIKPFFLYDQKGQTKLLISWE